MKKYYYFLKKSGLGKVHAVRYNKNYETRSHCSARRAGVRFPCGNGEKERKA